MEKKPSKQLYRAIEEEDSYMPDSTETEGRKRAISFKGGKLLGPIELEPAEPEIIEKTVYQPVYVKETPSFSTQIKRRIANQLVQEAPEIVRDIYREYKDAKTRKQRVEIAEAQKETAIARRDAAIAQREAKERELELEKFKAEQRKAEERKRKEAALSVEQRQVIVLSKALNEAYSSYLRDTTKEEVCRSLIRALYYFIMGIREIENIKSARIVDAETGEYVYGAEIIQEIPWNEVLQNFNNLLKANPNWLSHSQVASLSETFGREFIINGIYNPLRAGELQSCLTAITES